MNENMSSEAHRQSFDLVALETAQAIDALFGASFKSNNDVHRRARVQCLILDLLAAHVPDRQSKRRAEAAETRVRDLEAGLRPFADFAPKAEGFVIRAANTGGSPILPPTKHFHLNDFRRARALLSGTAAEGDGWQLTFAALREANAARQVEWCPDQLPDLSFRGNELAGETGEACNIIKKLERERHGWRGSRATTDDLLQELADVVICADLTAIQIGADLGMAVAAKFNATSTKHNLSVQLHAPPAPSAEAGER